MTDREFWKQWHEHKNNLRSAHADVHTDFDDQLMGMAVEMLTDSDRNMLAAEMRRMTNNYETYGSLEEPK